MVKHTILIIGAGQLGLLLLEESVKLSNYIKKIYVYTDNEDNCCKYNSYPIDVEIIIGDYNDKNKLNEISDKCDYITYEFENFSLDTFNENNLIKIYPEANILKIIQDKYTQKQFMLNKNIDVPPFSIVNSYQDIINFIDIHNYPVFLKNRKGSFDGRGNYLIKNIDDLNNLINIESNKYIIEKYINFDKEVSIIGCKNANNDFIYYDIVENKHKNSILIETIFPDNTLNNVLKNKIISILSNILDIFNTRGIICVEFFIKGDNIYYNECCLRVHNSGHHTLKSSTTSQFENHLRSVINLKLEQPKNLFSGNFYNIISELQTEEYLYNKYNFKKNPYFIKYYNKKPIGIRKIGHVIQSNK